MGQDVRREALAALAEVWALSPDVRLGQLVAHLGLLGEVRWGRGLGDIDDDEMVSVLYKHHAELQARTLAPSPIQALAQTSPLGRVLESV